MKNLHSDLFKTKTNQTDDNFIKQNKQNLERKLTKIDPSIMKEKEDSETLISLKYPLPNYLIIEN